MFASILALLTSSGAIAVIGQVAVWAFSLFLRSTLSKETFRQEFPNFIAVMDRLGYASVKMRIEASKQKDDIADQWAEEEKQNPNPIDQLQGKK